jgi:hypothetical protein
MGNRSYIRSSIRPAATFYCWSTEQSGGPDEREAFGFGDDAVYPQTVRINLGGIDRNEFAHCWSRNSVELRKRHGLVRASPGVVIKDLVVLYAKHKNGVLRESVELNSRNKRTKVRESETDGIRREWRKCVELVDPQAGIIQHFDEIVGFGAFEHAARIADQLEHSGVTSRLGQRRRWLLAVKLKQHVDAGITTQIQVVLENKWDSRMVDLRLALVWEVAVIPLGHPDYFSKRTDQFHMHLVIAIGSSCQPQLTWNE